MASLESSSNVSSKDLNLHIGNWWKRSKVEKWSSSGIWEAYGVCSNLTISVQCHMIWNCFAKLQEEQMILHLACLPMPPPVSRSLIKEHSCPCLWIDIVNALSYQESKLQACIRHPCWHVAQMLTSSFVEGTSKTVTEFANWSEDGVPIPTSQLGLKQSVLSRTKLYTRRGRQHTGLCLPTLQQCTIGALRGFKDKDYWSMLPTLQFIFLLSNNSEGLYLVLW
jgi:hypothetical protein